jgi:hypothetical protein
MMQMTVRDEAMLDWLRVVRMADIQGIRYALGGLGGAGTPVSTRRAQQWVSKLVEENLLGRARPTFRDDSIVWGTPALVGKPAPNLFRQTVRHEVAVAMVSARYLCQGFTWATDRKPTGLLDHQTDGVATRGDRIESIEVELTPKKRARYKMIFDSHAFRLTHEHVTRVVYLCTAEAARTVTREADRYLFRDVRPQLLCLPAFDVRGRFIGNDKALWSPDLPPAVMPVDPLRPDELAGFRTVEGGPR